MEEKDNTGVRSAINNSLLTNAKLAKALEVFMGYHMSTREKTSISKRIDACGSFDELEGTMQLINRELHAGFVDPDTAEKWSPQFVNDIKGYYENGFPFNPATKLKERFSPIKEFVILQEVVMKLDDGPQKDLMLSQLAEMKTECNQAIKDMDGLLDEMGG